MLRETETSPPAEAAGEEGSDTPHAQQAPHTSQTLHAFAPAPARLPSHEVDALIFGAEGGRGPQSLSARVERMLAQCRRQRGTMALVCVRVERIEAPGEAPGEPLPEASRRQVCADLAHRMRTRVRGSDLVVQEGEHDAAVLMAGSGPDAARRVAQRFAQALSGAYRVAERLVQVTVAVGHAGYPEDGTLGAELVLKARKRMQDQA
jgi:GGDEF domain-containing protein